MTGLVSSIEPPLTGANYFGSLRENKRGYNHNSGEYGGVGAVRLSLFDVGRVDYRIDGGRCVDGVSSAEITDRAILACHAHVASSVGAYRNYRCKKMHLHGRFLHMRTDRS